MLCAWSSLSHSSVPPPLPYDMSLWLVGRRAEAGHVRGVWIQLGFLSAKTHFKVHLLSNTLQTSFAGIQRSRVQQGELLDFKSIRLTAAAWKHTDETHCGQIISRSCNYLRTLWAVFSHWCASPFLRTSSLCAFSPTCSDRAHST